MLELFFGGAQLTHTFQGAVDIAARQMAEQQRRGDHGRGARQPKAVIGVHSQKSRGGQGEVLRP